MLKATIVFPINNRILFAVIGLCCFVLSACASVSQDEQLLTAAGNFTPRKSDGTCTESSISVEEHPAAIAGLSPDNISLFGWNMYKGSLDGWDDDFLRFSNGKDIILLQEASLDKRLQEVLQQQNLYWNLNNAFLYQEHETGVLLASAVPAIVSCGQRTREPIIGIPKTILIAKYAIAYSEKELLLANVHGINFTLGTGAYREQFDGLERILQNHNGPLIVAGDFNNWSDGRSDIVSEFATRLSLQILRFEDESRTAFFGDPVDHVFYRGLEPFDSKAYPVDSSDHNPITVNFRLSGMAAE